MKSRTTIFQELLLSQPKKPSRESKKNVVAEDAGFFVNALHGFPGPYSSYVYEKLGVQGILKLMQDVTQRDAFFSSAVAYSSRGHASACFEGIVKR